MIIFYFCCDKFRYIFHALKDWFTIHKHSVGSSLHPSFVANDYYPVFAMKYRNLVVEAMLVTLKDSDTTISGLLVGRVSTNNMSIWCLVGAFFGLSTLVIAYILDPVVE